MTDKTEKPDDAHSVFENAGLGEIAGMSTAWMETLSDMGAEMLSFVATRIKEDVETQHKILHCKSPEELKHIQAEFMQTAMDQYHDETGKLVDIGAKVFNPADTDQGT